MKKITAIIADDELHAREAIRLRLKQHTGVELLAETDNGDDALLLCCSLNPDVIFLDINMPKLSGVDAAKRIKEQCDSMVVFISAYNEYALQAFRQNALDYLTKPIDDEEFADMLNKVKHRQQEKHVLLEHCKPLPNNSNDAHYLKRISLKDGDVTSLYNTSDIALITSVKDYLCIHIDEKVFILRMTMQQMEQQLSPFDFIRCHRSHIVNINKVRQWLTKENRDYLLVCEHQVPVSRRYKTKIKTQLLNDARNPS